MKYLANENRNVSYLDNFLLEKNGDLKIVESRLLKSLQINDLQAWCKLRGIYCLPTKELIFWLKEEINAVCVATPTSADLKAGVTFVVVEAICIFF